MTRTLERTIRIPWGSLAVKEWGDPSGAPVLALHGWLDNLASFETLAPLLAAKGRHVVALDLPGHGHSDHHVAGLAYHFIDGTTLIAHALAALGWSRCTLLGHSMGGGLASVLAGTFPERFDKVILIESLGPWSSEQDEMAENLKRFFEAMGDLAVKRKPVYPSVEAAVQMRAKVSEMPVTVEASRILCHRGLMPVDGGYTWRADPRLRLPSPARLTEKQVLAFLSRIAAPVLVIQGDHGLYREARWLDRLQALKHPTHVVLPGGHHLHLETPGPVADAILSHH